MIQNLFIRRMREALIAPWILAAPLLLGLVTLSGCGGGEMPASRTLESIHITPTNPSIVVAATQQFTATGTYTDNSTRDLTTEVSWASADVSVAAISNTANSGGLATGLVGGSSSVTAALDGVTSPAVTLTVTGHTETLLYSFTGQTDGGNQEAGLIQASDGDFYGVTGDGGANFAGTVFKLTPAGVETLLYPFAGHTDGANPNAGLIQAADGDFYGATGGGGANDAGTVFKLTPAGVETVLHSFTGGADGANPYAALIQATGGNFYGTTYSGGANDAGTVFKLTPAGVETLLYSFTGVRVPDAATLQVGLIQAADGNFYGTTYSGGANGVGTIFNLTPAGVETVLYSFTGVPDGANPYAGLIQAVDGYFYGTTYSGGASNLGAVYKF